MVLAHVDVIGYGPADSDESTEIGKSAKVGDKTTVNNTGKGSVSPTAGSKFSEKGTNTSGVYTDLFRTDPK